MDINKEMLTEAMQSMADDLIKTATRWGLVLTIEQRPLQPPAMGHYETVASIRPAKERA